MGGRTSGSGVGSKSVILEYLLLIFDICIQMYPCITVFENWPYHGICALIAVSVQSSLSHLTESVFCDMVVL